MGLAKKWNCKMRLWQLAIAFLVSATTVHAQPDCRALNGVQIAHTTITEAQDVAAHFSVADASRGAAPQSATASRSFCRVKGLITPSPTSQIRFETWLPADWNGDYFQTGNGGLAGAIRYPELVHALNRGFAASSTDNGTSQTDFSWTIDPARMLDYRDRAAHLTAVAGQALTRAYYGKSARHRFFMGGSKGGQEAMTQVQRYPDDFDGIVAIYPASRGEFQAASTLWWAQQMNRTPGSMLGPVQLQLLNAAVLKQCGGKDGGLASDGFLTDPRLCTFDPGQLLCKAGQSEGCLTVDQVATAGNLYAGPAGYSELRMVPGSEWPQLGQAHGWQVLDGTLVRAFQLEGSIGQGVLGKPNWTYKDFDIEKDMPRIIASGRAEPGNTFDPDIRKFQQNGGKLILIHGWNDPMVPSLHSPLYWDMVVADQAKADPKGKGLARTRAFLRLFMIPGYRHGQSAGLEPADPLSAIVAWVKTGKAPDSLPSVQYADAAQWARDNRLPSAYVPDMAGSDSANRPIRLRRDICAWPLRMKVTRRATRCIAAP
jgi:feruloyl esterase